MKKNSLHYYKIAQKVERKLNTIDQPEKLYDNTLYKNINETLRTIHKCLLTLYNIDANNNTEKTNNDLEILLEFETFLHYSNTNHKNKRKHIINKLIDNPALTSYNEVKAFFCLILFVSLKISLIPLRYSTRYPYSLTTFINSNSPKCYLFCIII